MNTIPLNKLTHIERKKQRGWKKRIVKTYLEHFHLFVRQIFAMLYFILFLFSSFSFSFPFIAVIVFDFSLSLRWLLPPSCHCRCASTHSTAAAAALAHKQTPKIKTFYVHHSCERLWIECGYTDRQIYFILLLCSTLHIVCCYDISK